MADLSKDESEQWCGVGGCLLAPVPTVTDPLSLVNVVCNEVVSDSDCDFVEPQTRENSTRVWRWSRLGEDPRRKVGLTKQSQNVCEADRRHYLKAQLYKFDRHGQAH